MPQSPVPSKPSELHYAKWNMDVRETRLRIARDMILQEKPGDMLDLACSAGEFTSQFIPLGWHVIGTDNQPEKLRQAESHGIETRYCQLETEPIPVRDASVDLVFAGEIIEHMVDTDRFLREIRRVLKPGGVLVLTTPNLLSLENRLRMLLGLYPAWVDCRNTELGHVRSYTFAALRRQLRANGFTVEQERGNYVPMLANRLLFLDDRKYNFVRFSGWLFPHLAGTIIMKARISTPAGSAGALPGRP